MTQFQLFLKRKPREQRALIFKKNGPEVDTVKSNIPEVKLRSGEKMALKQAQEQAKKDFDKLNKQKEKIAKVAQFILGCSVIKCSSYNLT